MDKKGYLALVLVTVIYGSYGVMIRLVGQDFAVFSQAWIRNLLVAVMASFGLWLLKIKLKPIQRKHWLWIVLWLLSGIGTIPLTFTAFNNLPIGTTYILIYVAMITTGYLSGWIFFKEKITALKVGSIFLAFIGLLIIYSINIAADKMLFFFIALGSGALTGLWNTVTKKFSDSYSNLQLVLIDGFASFAVSLVAFFALGEGLPEIRLTPAWGWIVLYACFQMAAVGLVVYGFKHVEAQIGSIILPLETFFGALFGFVVFGEALSGGTLIGGLLILLAATLPGIGFVVPGLKRRRI